MTNPRSISPFYKSLPSFVGVFKLSSPVAFSASTSLQIEAIVQAKLVDINFSSSEFANTNYSASVMGQTLEGLFVNNAVKQNFNQRSEIYVSFKRFIKSNYHLEDLITKWPAKEGVRQFKTSYYGLVDDNHLTGLVMINRDDGATLVQEELVSIIAQNLAATSGSEFFSQLVERLAKTLGMSFASVAEIIPEKEDAVRLLAYYDKSHVKSSTSPTEHPLKDTPVYPLLQGREVVFDGDRLQEFSEVSQPFMEGINCYIGVPFFGSNNKPLGFVSLMHTEKIHNVDLVRSVLKIFSVRVAAEIERRRLEKESASIIQQQKVFIENSTSGMFVMDVSPPMPTNLPVQRQVQWIADNGRLVNYNKALMDLFSISQKGVLFTKVMDGIVNFDYATHAREFIAQEYKFREHLMPMARKAGEEVWVSTSVSAVIDGQHLTRILGMMTDVSERVRHSKDMEYRAKHDGLTGLVNRSYFVEQMESLLKLSPAGSKHALFLLDLDGFKEVNDTLGHETGDYLLQQIGPRLEPVLLQHKALLARLGGDEFAVLIEGCESEETVKEFAEKLMEQIKRPFTINDLDLIVGGSLGVALYPSNSDTVSSLMRCADIAMYQAKQQAIDYCIYNADRDHYTVRRLSLMMDIRHAIDNDDLILFYQPIVNLTNQQVIGFEALIRWQHPELGMLAPNEFIPLIELTDMIMPVTKWVVETTIVQLAQWKKLGWNYRVSINVSTRNLVDSGFAKFIGETLKQYGVDGHLLEIEITESTLMADPEKARTVLQSLSAMGMQISIDDYGTGYSSLAYLKSLPINTLKIDREFISQMLDNTQDQIIVNSTIQLAHNLGLKVTAEGIENIELIQALKELGCDKGQGFYLCKPIPINELEAWLSLYNRTSSLVKPG